MNPLYYTLAAEAMLIAVGVVFNAIAEWVNRR